MSFSKGWGPAGPGAWYETPRGPRSVATNQFVPRAECDPAMISPAPRSIAQKEPDTAVPEPDPAVPEPDTAVPEPDPAVPGPDGIPPPSPPTADTYAGPDAPELVELDPSAAPPTGDDGAAFDFHGVGGEECGEDCPYCESAPRTCARTGRTWYPVSRESAAVMGAILAPVLVRIPFRGVPASDIPPDALRLTEGESEMLQDALYQFLRRRAAFIGQWDDILGLGAVTLAIVAPRMQVALEGGGAG